MWKFVFLAMWLVVLSGCQTVSHSTQSIPDPLAAAKNRLALGLTYLKSNNFTFHQVLIVFPKQGLTHRVFQIELRHRCFIYDK